MGIAYLVQVDEPENKGDHFWANVSVHLHLEDAMSAVAVAMQKDNITDMRVLKLCENGECIKVSKDSTLSIAQ